MRLCRDTCKELVESSLFGCLQRIHHRRTYAIKFANSCVHRPIPYLFYTIIESVRGGEWMRGPKLPPYLEEHARFRTEARRTKTGRNEGAAMELYVSVDATLAPNALNQIKQTRPPSPPRWRPTAYNIFQSRPGLRTSLSSQILSPSSLPTHAYTSLDYFLPLAWTPYTMHGRWQSRSLCYLNESAASLRECIPFDICILSCLNNALVTSWKGFNERFVIMVMSMG